MASSRWSLKLLIHSCLPLPMVTAASVAPLADVAVCRSQAPQSPSSIQTLQANLLLTPTSEVDCVARVHRSARTHRSHSMSHSVELHEPKSSMPQRRSSPERLDVVFSAVSVVLAFLAGGCARGGCLTKCAATPPSFRLRASSRRLCFPAPPLVARAC